MCTAQNCIDGNGSCSSLGMHRLQSDAYSGRDRTSVWADVLLKGCMMQSSTLAVQICSVTCLGGEYGGFGLWPMYASLVSWAYGLLRVQRSISGHQHEVVHINSTLTRNTTTSADATSTTTRALSRCKADMHKQACPLRHTRQGVFGPG